MKNGGFHRIAMLGVLAACVAGCGYESYYDRCEREMREFTQLKCPFRVDEFTIEDSVLFIKQDTTLMYSFTVTGELDDEEVYSSANVEKFRESLCESLRGSVEKQKLKEHGVRFRYVYHSASTRKVLLDITLDREEYE